MKFAIFFSFLINFQMVFSQNLDEFRTLLKSGETSEVATKSLIEKSESSYKTTKKPIYKGFLAVGKFLMANHAFNPLKKMSYFNEGKKNLETAINDDPKNLELRLMRLITQEKIPKILNYHQKIVEDRNFLTKEYHNTSDQNLKLFIKEYLKI